MNIKMRVTNFLWLILCLVQSLSAQKGVVSSGGDIESPNGSVAYSVGQIVYEPIYGETGKVNPGLQQPFQFSIVAINDVHETYLLNLYPNPANRILYLTLSTDESKIQGHDFMARIYDVKGNFLFNQKLRDEVNTISISGLPEELYFIQIWQSNTFIQSISFSKTN